MDDLAVVVGYIMYHQLLEDKINGSFFSQIDVAIEIGKHFCEEYPEDFNWEELDFEKTLSNFVKNY